MLKDTTTVPFFVLGNKVDKPEEREVPVERVEEWLKHHPEFTYFETSAVDGSNVNLVFNKIAQKYLDMKSQESINLPESLDSSETTATTEAGKRKFALNNQKTQQKKRCC
mmetsp:Transcript_22923/g.35296  ORF Transcript_22923/g.35296 Transcript_22923/m.35296 type:complete len:110 (-) Transcript_22923:8-337(-)